MAGRLPELLTMNIEFQPKQRLLFDLMESDHSLLGYGGARGGGKSHLLRSVALLRRLKYPGTRSLVFRRVYDQLWQQHIMRIQEEWPALYKACWHADSKALMMPNGGMVLFRYGDTKQDIRNFKGQEYDDVFIDEADDLEEDEITSLSSCCRSTHPTIKPKVVMAFNPGGRGHVYLKRVFVDNNLTPEEATQSPAFVHAHAWDNILWVRSAMLKDGLNPDVWWTWPIEQRIAYLVARSDYGRKLNALSLELRRAWLYGDFDTFSGQEFDDFRRPIHVGPDFKVPTWWTQWGSNDPGFTDAGVWYTMAADGNGRVYITHEWTFEEPRTPYSQQAAKVKEDICKENNGDNPISYWVTGMDAFTPHPESKKSIVDYYHEGGLSGFIKPDHGSGARSRRCATWHEYLKVFKDHEGRDTAKVYIMESCKKLIETLPSLPSDPTHKDQVQECAADHWYDGSGYGLQSRHGTGDKPKSEFPVGTIGAAWGDPQQTIADRVAESGQSDSMNDFARRIFKKR